MLTYTMLSDKIATTVATFCVTKGKELAAKRFHDAYEDAVLKPDLLMVYTDS